MGAWVKYKCPIEGCTYQCTFRIPSDDEGDPMDHGSTLREEHPNHPPDPNPPEQ